MDLRFVADIKKMHGKKGEEWLNNLPQIISSFEKRWALKVGEPFSLSYNYTAPGICEDGTPVVLKIGFPTDKEFQTEIEALKIFDGRGTVKLLGADPEQAVMLLEKLEPGEPLSKLEDDEEQTLIAAKLMKKIWRPVPDEHNFPAITDWGKGFDRYKTRPHPHPLPQDLFNEAEKLFKDLVESMSEPVLLHGDFHHANILSASREPWLAIDAKGLIGEKEYEAGALLRSPWSKISEHPNPGPFLKKRVDLLSKELEVNPARIQNWGIVQSVLAAIWVLEDFGSGWETPIASAKALLKVAEVLNS